MQLSSKNNFFDEKYRTVEKRRANVIETTFVGIFAAQEKNLWAVAKHGRQL